MAEGSIPLESQQIGHPKKTFLSPGSHIPLSPLSFTVIVILTFTMEVYPQHGDICKPMTVICAQLPQKIMSRYENH